MKRATDPLATSMRLGLLSIALVSCRSHAAGALVSPHPEVVDLQVIGGDVIYSDADDLGLKRMPLAGGTPTTLASPKRPAAFTVDGTDVYWADADAGTVQRVARQGGAPILLASKQHDPGSVAVDAVTVYWSVGTEGIRSAPKAGGTTAIVTTATAGKLVVDASTVYFVGADGGLWSTPKGGGTPKKLAADDHVLALALDDSAIYALNMTSPSEQRVLRVAKTGGAPTELARMASTGMRLLVAVGSVWFAASDGNGETLDRVPVHGGATVAAGACSDRIRGIAEDGSSVLFACAGAKRGEGGILRVPGA